MFNLRSNSLLPLDNRLVFLLRKSRRSLSRVPVGIEFMDFSTIEMPRCRVTRRQPSNQEVRPELTQEREQEGDHYAPPF